MRKTFLIFLAAICFVPVAARADLNVADLPDGSTWYVHIDLEQMRSAGASQRLYAWLDDEVFEEVRDEAGIDLDREINQITAYSAAESSPVIVLEGPVSQRSIDRLMDLADDEHDIRRFKTQGMEFFYIDDDGKGFDNGNIDIDGMDEGAYFSFALRDKIIVTPSREQMEALLINNGRVPGSRSHSDALFVLSAERNLVQAGANAERFSSGRDDWDSKLLRNTRQVALLVADSDGRIAIDARLQATEPDMANSLANIARGLIGLASFSDDMEPQVAELLRSTRIDVTDDVLKVSVAVDPDAFVKILED